MDIAGQICNKCKDGILKLNYHNIIVRCDNCGELYDRMVESYEGYLEITWSE